MVNNLYYFYQYFITQNLDGNKPAQHLHDLADALTSVYDGSGKSNLAVSMPPQHAKSSMVTLSFPVWLIFQNPRLKILIINSEAGLSETFGIQLREIIKKWGPYFNVYLSDTKSASTYMMFCNRNGELYNGEIRLVGSNGSITGHPVDYLIIDDPYKGFDDITPTLLQKKLNWYKTIVRQRIRPHTKQIVLHTRWHSNDLIGYFKDNEDDDFDFVNFKGISNNNTPLWPELYPIQFYKEQEEKMGERLFQSIYQQEPLDESGDFFNLDYLNIGRPTNPISSTVRSWDIASTKQADGKDTDYTSGVKCHKCGDDFLITNLVHGRFGDDNLDRIRTTAKLDGTSTPVLIETGVGNANLLYTEWKNQLHDYNVEQSKPQGSKEDRATPFKNALLDGHVYLDIHSTESKEKVLEEMKGFPLAKHDDIIDSIAYAYNYLFLENNKQVGDVFYVNL